MDRVSHTRGVILLSLSVVLCSVVSVVESQAPPSSFLRRFPVRSTNALGEQMMKLFVGRLQQEHFSGERPEPAIEVVPGAGGVNNATRTPRPVSTRVPVGELPGGNSTEGPDYTTVVNGPVTPSSLVVVLHGMGSKPEELLPLYEISKGDLPLTRFIFVRAPRQRVNYIGKVLESWFQIEKRLAGRENVGELRAAAAGVSKIILAQKSLYNITDDKIVVLGMSQGGAVALTFYLAEKVRVAGVIGAATWLPLPTLWKKEALAAENDYTPCHLVHGRQDVVITAREAQSSRDILRRLGREVTYREYAGAGHSMVARFGAVVPDLVAKTKEMLGE